ncbi:MAG TPA: hypothetical protein VF331_11645 [Polyangiales bacterium]
MLTTSGVFALAAFTGCFDYADLNNMLSPVVVGVLTALAQTGGFAVGTGVAGPLGAFAQPLLAKNIFRREGVAAQAGDAQRGGWQTGHSVYPAYRP